MEAAAPDMGPTASRSFTHGGATPIDAHGRARYLTQSTGAW